MRYKLLKLILKVRKMELRDFGLPNTTHLVIVGGRILTQVCLTLIAGLLAIVLLYLYTMPHFQTLLSLQSMKCLEAFASITIKSDTFRFLETDI